MTAEVTDPDAPGTEQGEFEIAIRPTDGTVGKIVFWYSVAVALLHLYMNALGGLLVNGLEALDIPVPGLVRTLSLPPPLLQNALHFACFALLGSYLYPMAARYARNRSLMLVDLAIGLIGAGGAMFLILSEDAIYARGVTLEQQDWIAGILMILAGLELVRRTTGWIVPVLVVLALSYATWLGPEVPGIFRFTGLSAETMLFRSVFGDDGKFGNIAGISSGVVIMFILFGAFLIRSGAGAFIVAFADAVAGRLVGGPGMVAVLASGLTGTISGSAVANTAQTGTITIPLMIRAGFPRRFAAGVEAAASTGGQMMPPIMGAGAFIMSTYTQISYTTIVAVAALPAVLYFLSVAFYVRVEARRNGLHPSPTDGQSVWGVLAGGGLSFLPPILVLIACLFVGFTPTYAAGIAILAVIAFSWLGPEPMGPRAVAEALALGTRNMATTAILLVVIGLFVNVIPTTGLGNTLSLMISDWAGGNLLIAVILVALASLVLGLGLPVTAAYVVLAVLSAPALYQLITAEALAQVIAAGALPMEAGFVFALVDPALVERLASPMPVADARALLAASDPAVIGQVRDLALPEEVRTMALLSAHMIIFWLSQDSNVTPPVCLTAFTAAAIARTPPMATGFEAWKIAKALYVIPLLFAYTPLIGGTWLEVLAIFAASAIGLYAMTAAIQGHLESRLGPVGRIVAGGLAFALFWPGLPILHAAAAVAFLVFLVKSWQDGRRAALPTAAMAPGAPIG